MKKKNQWTSFSRKTMLELYFHPPLFLLLVFFPVGCLWHSHGKNPVRLYPKLQSQPIGLRKIFIDYFFFQVDQWDCTKPLSIFDRLASSEERFIVRTNCKASQQDCLKSLSIISSFKPTNQIVQNLYRFLIDLLPQKNVEFRTFLCQICRP